MRRVVDGEEDDEEESGEEGAPEDELRRGGQEFRAVDAAEIAVVAVEFDRFARVRGKCHWSEGRSEVEDEGASSVISSALSPEEEREAEEVDIEETWSE